MEATCQTLRHWPLNARGELQSAQAKKVTREPKYSPFGPDEREEKTLQEWVEELLKNALAEDRRKESREREKVEQEDAQSQRCQARGKLPEPRVLFPPITFGAGNRHATSRRTLGKCVSRLLPAGLLSGDDPPCPEHRGRGSLRTFDLSRCQHSEYHVGTGSSRTLPLSRTKSLRQCAQLSRLRICGVCCVAWRRASTVEILWLCLVELTRAQNLASELRANELADIKHQEFAAEYTRLKPAWTGLPRLATHECNGECRHHLWAGRTTQSVVTLVENQGQCGFCCVFERATVC